MTDPSPASRPDTRTAGERSDPDSLAPPPPLHPRRLRRSLALRSGLAIAAVPLVMVLVVSAATLIRVQGEYRRAAAVKAQVGSRWLADRLAREDRAAWPGVLKKAEAWLEAPVGVFLPGGAPVLRGGITEFSRTEIGTLLVSGGELRGHLIDSARIRDLGDAPAVVLAVKGVPDFGTLLRSALPRVGVAALALVPLGFAFGFFFGTAIDGRLARLRQQLRAITGQVRTPSVVYDENAEGSILEELNLATDALRARFREELVLYEDALAEVDFYSAQKTEFLRALARELRAPLDFILDRSNALINGRHGELPPSQAEDMQIVRKGAERLLSLVNDVDDLSAIMSAGIEYDEAPVDLAEVAGEVVKASRWAAGEDSVAVTLDVQAGIRPEVRGSRRRIWQILTNLVSNAVKFTEQGEVRVRILAEGEDRLAVEVSDTGTGIPASEHTAIFDPFRQHGDRKKRIRGTGLGLAISKRLAELHHGGISVRSEEGKGSVFTVSLPKNR